MAKKLSKAKRRNLRTLISESLQRKIEKQWQAFEERQNRAYMAIYC